MDIKQVIETYTGRRFHGNRTLCPFHNDIKHPSLSVKTETGKWRCFTCQKGGNAINFVREFYGLSFIDAVKKLSADFNVNGIGLVDSASPMQDIWAVVETECRQRRIQELKQVRDDIDSEIDAMTVIHRAMLRSGAPDEALNRYAQEIDDMAQYKEFWR